MFPVCPQPVLVLLAGLLLFWPNSEPPKLPEFPNEEVDLCLKCCPASPLAGFFSFCQDPEDCDLLGIVLLCLLDEYFDPEADRPFADPLDGYFDPKCDSLPVAPLDPYFDSVTDLPLVEPLDGYFEDLPAEPLDGYFGGLPAEPLGG